MMTLTIDFTPELEARLNAEARLQGLEPGDFVKKLVAEHVAPLTENHEQALRQRIMEELVEETERLGLYQ